MSKEDRTRQKLTQVPITEGGSKRNRAQKAEEQRVCFQLRLQGHEIRAVARLASEELGWYVSRDTAWRRIEQEGLQRVQPAEDALRELELSRLDRYLLAAESVAASSLDPKDKLAALDRAMKVQERRAKLLGLDAPERHEVSVSKVDDRDAELLAILQEEEAKRERERR